MPFHFFKNLFACIVSFLGVWTTSLSAFTMSAHQEIIRGQIYGHRFILQHKYSELKKKKRQNKKQATHTQKPPTTTTKTQQQKSHNQNMVLNYKHSFCSDSWLGEAQR